MKLLYFYTVAGKRTEVYVHRNGLAFWYDHMVLQKADIYLFSPLKSNFEFIYFR